MRSNLLASSRFKAVLALTGLAVAAQAHAQLTLSSPQVTDGRMPASAVYDKMGCNGENKPVILQWTGLPSGTRSVAVTLFDMDAPTGSGWWHWIVYDIPPSKTDVGRQPVAHPARQASNDFGSAGYGGPCPPPGDKPHRYVATVHALKVERLALPAGSTPAFARYMIHANTIESAKLQMSFSR